jgi:hypothetical protein
MFIYILNFNKKLWHIVIKIENELVKIGLLKQIIQKTLILEDVEIF